ncbi:MAG: AAA family ATPase [Planktomarina sp.]|nr:AAA family ATPase [Planktomarina sp.]
MTENIYTTRWINDLERFLPLKPSFLLSGNVADYQICDMDGIFAPLSLHDTLTEVFCRNGYGTVLIYDPARGFYVNGENQCDLIKKLGVAVENGRAPLSTNGLAKAIERFIDLIEPEPVALIIDFAGRLVIRPDGLEQSENALFTQALIGAYRAKPKTINQRPYYNTIVFVTEKEGDVPDWMVVDNACLRHIPVAKPDASARRVVAPDLLKVIGGEVTKEVTNVFVQATEGMLLRDLLAIVQLGKTEGMELAQISDVVRYYKVGVTEDPWKKIPRDTIVNGEATIRKRVKGQGRAVTHMLDVVKRAITGIGMGANSRGKPRGFALFAGPTGVGKTELAKTITELLFGDEESYIRFDMSEFSAEHADQRLVGAPPGYVGYDQGGELTNAIREKPFSVVLFDEIEKAHPKILDKFLQILDDGVLTSGRGDRVYFSEAIIIFTSNLGISKLNQDGVRVANVEQNDDYTTIKSNVRSEIERHFKMTLGRPEMLNRMGENIIVFDFIRDEIADEIYDSILSSIIKNLMIQGTEITLTEEVSIELKAFCLRDLSNGGRGIRNQLEAHFVNPLARHLFDVENSKGARFEVDNIKISEVTSLQLREV